MFSYLYHQEKKTVVSKDNPVQVIQEERDHDLVKHTLANGNQIMESQQLTYSIHNWRLILIDRLRDYRTIFQEKKQYVYQKKDSADVFIQKNILNNQYENQNVVVPSAILSFGAFFTGRILSNKGNWGFSSEIVHKPGLIGKAFTSIPSRVLLPWLLAGATFSKISPITYHNCTKAVEDNLFPEDFVQKYHEIWQDVYVNCIKSKSSTISETFNKTLESNIKYLRELVCKSLYD